jgi:hypothetical protein
MKTRITQILLALVITALLQGVAAAQRTIDDFSTGAYQKTLPTKTAVGDVNVQKGNMIGGERWTYLQVCHQVPCNAAENEFAQSATLQIRPSKNKAVPSALILSGGYKTLPLIEVFWGIDSQHNVAPLHLDLTPYDRMRVSFDGIDQVVNFNLQLYTPTGSGQLGCNLLAVAPVPPPFTVDFPLVDFIAGNCAVIDFADITYMSLIGNASKNYAITKYEALSPGGSAPSFTCTGH